MQFLVDGTQQQFVPIQEFRRRYRLPAEFGIAMFEPKDYSGLGRIDTAGAKLKELHEHILASLPDKLTIPGWLSTLPSIVRTFEHELLSINDIIGLREAEIGFAVSGFADVLQNYLFNFMRVRMQGINLVPSFLHSYGEWLSSTMRVSQREYCYHQWTIHVVTHAYGRCGLIVTMGADRQYVYDGSLGCPVEGFMMHLLSDITAKIAVRS